MFGDGREDPDDDVVEDLIPENDQPEEPDPEAELTDHESELPPEPPEPPDPSDVPKDLKRNFWGLVIVFNVAIFGITVGPMLIGFRGNWRFGGALLGLGIVALVHGLYRYRVVTSQHTEDDEDSHRREEDND